MGSLRAAIFRHATPNLGDDMQAYACLLHLAQVDELLDRDHIAAGPAPEAPLAFIANSWFLLGDDLRVPPPWAKPIWHGFRPDARLMSDAGWIQFLRDQDAHIGCRDLHVMQRLQQAGLPAYFSGCITLYLGRMLGLAPQPRSGVILLDVPEPVMDQLPRSLLAEAETLSTFSPAGDDHPLERMATVSELALRLSRAELVVTRRLHAALPAAGLGTPVLAVPDPAIAFARERFAGYGRLFPVVFSDEPEHRVRALDLATRARPTPEVALEVAHGLLCSRLRTLGLLASCAASRGVLDHPGMDRVRVPNPWPQRPRARFRIRLGSLERRLPVLGWSGRHVDLGLRCFPGLSRLSLRLEGQAADGDSWDDLGLLSAAASSVPPVGHPGMWAES